MDGLGDVVCANQGDTCTTTVGEGEVPCHCDLWCMDPTRQESCMNLDVQVGDAPLWWHGGEHINFPNAKQITQKHVRFNDQVQFILPAHDDEVWEQDDIALVQTETKFHSSVVSAIKELVGDVDSVQVVVWCIGPQGQGSNISKTVELQKHQEQHWCDASWNPFLGSWNAMQ